MWQIWLIIAGIFFILEIFTTGFLVFWFGIGSLLSMVVSFFTDNVIVQATVFLISSTILIVATKPLVDKLLGNKKAVMTNAYSIIGKDALVIEEINSLKGTGQIKIAGEVWSAKSSDEMVIPKDSKVEVLSIQGVKACVRLISTNNFSNVANM